MQGLQQLTSGAPTPSAGAKHPNRALALLGAGAVALSLMACSSKTDRTQTLEPQQLGMSDQMAPVFDDGETQLYEAKLPVQFPILAPSSTEMQELRKSHIKPFNRAPWLTNSDLQVRVSWTLSNLDASPHVVELLIDPWNEFGRYWPGLAVTDPQRQEFLPNLSGIDTLYTLDGKNSGDSSRRHGTFTVQDMSELAVDFATAINIIQNVPMPPPTAMSDQSTGPVMLVNHAFAVENRSYNDPLVKKYIPSAIPGLTGFDIGMRTTEPANVAVEFTVELIEKNGVQKVAPRGSTAKQLNAPTRYYTIDYGG